MNWINEEIADESKIGFTYCITNTLNNKKYYGKKSYKHKRTRPPLKGYKRKRIDYVDSGWKSYTGSSEELNDDIKSMGKEYFIFEIINNYSTKTQLSYAELELIVIHKCLRKPDQYYNRNILGKYYSGKV